MHNPYPKAVLEARDPSRYSGNICMVFLIYFILYDFIKEQQQLKNINSKGSLDEETLEYIDKFLINENNLNRVDLIVANIKQILNKYV